LDARLEGEFKEPTDGEDYYNQTFNQWNKQLNSQF
jgi:hypothetical protein